MAASMAGADLLCDGAHDDDACTFCTETMDIARDEVEMLMLIVRVTQASKTEKRALYPIPWGRFSEDPFKSKSPTLPPVRSQHI